MGSIISNTPKSDILPRKHVVQHIDHQDRSTRFAQLTLPPKILCFKMHFNGETPIKIALHVWGSETHLLYGSSGPSQSIS